MFRWPATSWVHYTTSCNTHSSAPEYGQNNCPKHVELTGIINKPLLLHLVGCLYYLYQWCTVKQISDNEIYLLIKYIKIVLWRVAKRLSYIEDARCLNINIWSLQRCLLWKNGKLCCEIIARPRAERNELRTQKERQTYKKKKKTLQNPLSLDRMKVVFNFEQNFKL